LTKSPATGDSYRQTVSLVFNMGAERVHQIWAASIQPFALRASPRPVRVAESPDVLFATIIATVSCHLSRVARGRGAEKVSSAKVVDMGEGLPLAEAPAGSK
jgi:hypothetical protein